MTRSDALVVGGGVIGLSVALELCRAGLSVSVVDPAPGHGASYLGAGMLAPVTEAAYGEESLLALNLASAEAWPAFAAQLEIDSGLSVGLRDDGTLLVAHDASDRAQLAELASFHQQLGLDSRWCPPSEARALEPLLANGVHGALFAASDRQVDNRRLLAALEVALRHAGARFIAAKAVALEHGGGAVTGVHLAEGSLAAPIVVLAAGYASGDLGGLPNDAVPQLRPVKGQILRLFAPDRELRLSRTIRADVLGHHVYVVPRESGRVVVGATVEEQGRNETVTSGAVYELLRDAIRVLPVVAEYGLLEAGAGLRPATADNTPLVDAPGLSGLVVAVGHYRNGILLAPTTAMTVRAIVEGDELPDYAAGFARDRAGRTRAGVAP